MSLTTDDVLARAEANAQANGTPTERTMWSYSLARDVLWNIAHNSPSDPAALAKAFLLSVPFEWIEDESDAAPREEEREG